MLRNGSEGLSAHLRQEASGVYSPTWAWLLMCFFCVFLFFLLRKVNQESRRIFSPPLTLSAQHFGKTSPSVCLPACDGPA